LNSSSSTRAPSCPNAIVPAMTPDEATASAVSDWLTAVGTVGATLAAVYVGVIRDRLRRPTLSLSFEPGTSDAILIRAFRVTEDSPEVLDYDEIDVAYLRLRVRNRAGRLAAEDVEVIVTGAREIGTQHQTLRIDGQPLAFSNSHPTATRMTVAPGGERHVDLVHVTVGTIVDALERRVPLNVHPGPADYQQRSVGPGVLELELTVTARNADAVRYVLELHVAEGRLRAADVWQRVRIENLRRLRV
jgi:hypothetical protein